MKSYTSTWECVFLKIYKEEREKKEGQKNKKKKTKEKRKQS